MAIELTSSSTRREDMEDKYHLYQDTLRVKEYFLFDPLGDYLTPPLQGHRLRRGQYHPIRVLAGRLPSRVLGLHLECNGRELRLHDPNAHRWLPTPLEMAAEAEAAREQAEAAREQTEAENERLRRELAALRRRLPNHRDAPS